MIDECDDSLPKVMKCALPSAINSASAPFLFRPPQIHGIDFDQQKRDTRVNYVIEKKVKLITIYTVDVYIYVFI